MSFTLVSPNGQVELFQYTASSYVVRGTPAYPQSTKAHLDTLKTTFSGRWNPNLTDPKTQQKFGAWIFPGGKKDDLVKWVSSLGAGAGAAVKKEIGNNAPAQNNNNNSNSQDAAAAAAAVDVVPQEKPAARPTVDLSAVTFPIVSTDGQLEAIKYSDKVVVLRGTAANRAATRHHTEAIKTDLSGRYNGMLTDPVDQSKFAGWIIFPDKLAQLQNFLSTACVSTPAPTAAELDKAPNNKPPTPALFSSADGEVKCIRYSDKSIAVKLPKDKNPALFRKLVNADDGLGGKYIVSLKDPANNQPFAGVIFVNGHLEKVKEFLKGFKMSMTNFDSLPKESGARRQRKNDNDDDYE